MWYGVEGENKETEVSWRRKNKVNKTKARWKYKGRHWWVQTINSFVFVNEQDLKLHELQLASTSNSCKLEEKGILTW